MRYLRMLSNSIAAAFLATMYVLALVAELNPNLVDRSRPHRAPASPRRPLLRRALLPRSFYVLLVVRQLLARELFSPAWLSIGALTWLGALAGGRRRR